MGLKRFVLLLAIAPVLMLYQNCSPAFSTRTLASSFEADTPGVMVPVFMASGHMARTLYSCDQGRTWIHDQSANDNARCWVDGDPNYVECDHTPYSGRGLDYTDGVFYVNFGWGANGSARSSSNGQAWTTLKSDNWGGGIAASDNDVFLLWNGGQLSSDSGQSWNQLQNSPLYSFSHPLVSHVGDKFIAMGRTDGVAISTDHGRTWNINSTFPAASGAYFAEGNGMLVGIGGSGSTPAVGYASRSFDGGVTWETNQVFSEDYRSWDNLIFNGTEFVAFSPGGLIWKSADAVTWTRANVSVPGLNLGLFTGPVGFDPSTGTYVRITNAWANYYSAQKALRSDDGINWTVLDASAFKGGHPISFMVRGELDSRYCR